MGVKYDLKASKDVIGSLYPRLIDKQGREIDGFHREDADSEWPVTQLAHIDTDVKFWTARIVANAHRRTVSKKERKKELTELAKALRAEGHEGSLVKIISGFTTFSERYIQGLLPKEFKQVHKKSELSSHSKQTSEKVTRKKTTDKEKLENLYKKVENSAFTGKISTSNLKLKAEELGLNVESYEIELKKIKDCLRDSVGRRYEDVKRTLNHAYNSSIVMKQTLKRQIEAEKERIKIANEELRKDPEFRKEIAKEIKNEQTSKNRARGDSIEDISKKLNIDRTRAWALALDGMNDISRLKHLSDNINGLECNPRPYDVWNFAKCCDLMGYEYKGRIPGQIVLQLLYFFTEQGDLVIDPMAGSGTVIDACLLMNRKCLAFDNRPESYENREDITEGEALETIQSLKCNPDLIFLDPPYFKKLEDEYSSESISALPRDKYLDFFSELAGESYKSGAKRVALLMSDYTDDEDPNLHIFIWDYVKRFIAEKWIVERHIMAPLSTQQIHPDFIEKFRKSKKLARLGRSLVVFKRDKK